jgi:chromosome partitioning protein
VFGSDSLTPETLKRKDSAMIIMCENCIKKFKVDEKLIKESGSKVRCSDCGHVFTAYRPAPVEEESPVRYNPRPPVLSSTDGTAGNVIAISNQKGGVAKTTTCLNLGISLALLNKRVLLVDFDVQSNLTISLGYRNTTSFYEVMNSDSANLDNFIIKTKYNNLSLLPSNKNMVLLNKKYFGIQNFEFILRDRLAFIKDQFDYIVIDTPPSIGFFSINTLTSADLVIIPCECEYLSTHGVEYTLNFIKLVKEKTNPRIDSKILITRYDETNTVAQLIAAKLKRMYKKKTFGTFIELDDKIKESSIMRMPVIYYDKQSRSGLKYMRLAKEILGNFEGEES